MLDRDQNKTPFPVWLYFFLLFLFIIMIWQMVSLSLKKETGPLTKKTAFTDVSNRDISLLLWQTPELRGGKDGGRYLPGFDHNAQMRLDVSLADLIAEAPLSLFFRYHTFKRLLVEEFVPPVIKDEELQEFLAFAPEWLPVNWKNAPEEYRLNPNGKTAPKEVQMAFQGWKNQFKEAEKIEAFRPTEEEITQFLEAHPNYKRNRFRNIIGPNYLKEGEPLFPFFKQALFNATTQKQ
jgi:hypothetical protein